MRQRLEKLAMIHIDGAAKSGSGTMVRYAIALSSLLGEEVHISNIRAKKGKTGLRTQHLIAVMACAQICGSKSVGRFEGDCYR